MAGRNVQKPNFEDAWMLLDPWHEQLQNQLPKKNSFSNFSTFTTALHKSNLETEKALSAVVYLVQLCSLVFVAVKALIVKLKYKMTKMDN